MLTDGHKDIQTDKPSYRDARMHLTSPGGQIDASVVVLYAIVTLLGYFERFSAFFSGMVTDGRTDIRTDGQTLL